MAQLSFWGDVRFINTIPVRHRGCALFLGILGGSFYLYVFYTTYVTVSLTKWLFYFMVIFAIIVCLAGNFFENASVAIYLLIFKEQLIENTADLKNRNE